MVTLHRQANWKIAVYGGDHGIPHFHVEGRDYRCSVAIRDGALIIGHAPPAILAAARAWAADHDDELMMKWQELNP